MKSFKQFLLKEQIIKEERTSYFSPHLSHLEDLAVENGKAGFKDFLTHVNLISKKIQGYESEQEINAKIDGSPAILFGIDPKTKTFFISLKYVVDESTDTIKENAKLFHTSEEIDQAMSDRPDFASRLKNLLEQLTPAYDNSGLIYQGDVLYASQEDKKRVKIGTEEFITFEPNTIMYAIPMDDKSELFHKVLNSSVGVVVHDSFKGVVDKESGIIKLVPASKNIDSLIASSTNSKAFIKGSNYRTFAFDIPDKFFDNLNTLIVDASKHINSISDEFNNEYVSPGRGAPSSQILDMLKRYLNKQLDLEDSGLFGAAKTSGRLNFNAFYKGFQQYVESQITKGIEGLGPKGQAQRQQRLSIVQSFLQNNAANFEHLLTATFEMVKIKYLIFNILSQLDTKLTQHAFYRLPDGSYVKTKDEGYVLFAGNNQVKIVDRVDFSKMNRLVGGRRRTLIT